MTLTTLTEQMATLALRWTTSVTTKFSEETYEVKEIRVPWGGNNCVVIAKNSSSGGEKSYEEEVLICGNRQDNHDYRVKDDIPFFYETMWVEEFLDWKIDVDRLFDVIDISENKQVKMVEIKLKSTSTIEWDKLVV